MKYEFASPGWFAFVHGRLSERFEALGSARFEVDWSICEIFSGPPVHLSPSGASLAWHCVIRDGVFRFAASEAGDVQLLVRADYASVLPIGRYETRGEPRRVAELRAMMAEASERGLLRIEGEMRGRDRRFADVHDILARATA